MQKTKLKIREIQGSLKNTIEQIVMEEAHSHRVYNDPQLLLDDLLILRVTIVKHYQSLFLDELDQLLFKVQNFGFYFASMDIRQDSRIIANVFNELNLNSINSNYTDLDEKEKIKQLKLINKKQLKVSSDQLLSCSSISKETIETTQLIPSIQKNNGEAGHAIDHGRDGASGLLVKSSI